MISHIDHLVLTVGDIEASVTFYKRALLLTDSTFANGRRALHFGNQKINLQVLGMEKRNRAAVGSGDLCLVTTWPLRDVVAHLRGEGNEIVEGPVAKTGAARCDDLGLLQRSGRESHRNQQLRRASRGRTRLTAPGGARLGVGREAGVRAYASPRRPRDVDRHASVDRGLRRSTPGTTCS